MEEIKPLWKEKPRQILSCDESIKLNISDHFTFNTQLEFTTKNPVTHFKMHCALRLTFHCIFEEQIVDVKDSLSVVLLATQCLHSLHQVGHHSVDVRGENSHIFGPHNQLAQSTAHLQPFITLAGDRKHHIIISRDRNQNLKKKIKQMGYCRFRLRIWHSPSTILGSDFCIYVIKSTVKTVILWNITIYNINNFSILL